MVEVRMPKIDSLHEKMVSFSEKVLSDTDVPRETKEEFRLLITELENTYSEHELKIRKLTEDNEDLLNSLRVDGSSHVFVDENLLLKKYFCVSRDEIQNKPSEIGKPLGTVSGQIKFCALIDDVKSVMLTGKNLTKEIPSIDNRWFNVTVMPRARGASISIREITAIKGLQEKLKDRNKSLIRINEDLDNFVYTTSRHLLEPLANLEGLLELLKLKIQSGNPDASPVLDMVQDAFGQFKLNISELDGIGVIEAGMLRSSDPIDFSWVVEDLKLGIQDLLEATGATLFTDFAVRQINFSKKSLRSILYNLITTALEYRSPARSPEFYISTYAVPGYIVLMVRDNGMGMPEDKLRTIFRNDSNSQHGSDYHGLGMYLVKKIIDSSGGRIEVENLFDEGMVFKIFLRFDFHIH